jgi:hypothetical protein
MTVSFFIISMFVLAMLLNIIKTLRSGEMVAAIHLGQAACQLVGGRRTGSL